MEPSEGNDLLAGKGENEHAAGFGIRLVTLCEVAGKGWLMVGPAREQIDATFASEGKAGF
jgi:hypothetical protein